MVRMEGYTRQINDIMGKPGLQVTDFETPTETKEERARIKVMCTNWVWFTFKPYIINSG